MEVNEQAGGTSRRALLIGGAGLGILGSAALLAKLFGSGQTALAHSGSNRTDDSGSNETDHSGSNRTND
jgi:hypothetical protein